MSVKAEKLVETAIASSKSDDADIKLNELLCYIQFYRDRASHENIRKVIVGFYTALEINSAKKLLINTFTTSLADCSLKSERGKSATRDVHEAETEDIFGIFDYLDQNFAAALNSVIFVATDFDHIPKYYGPEELNICAIVDKQCELEAHVASLSSRLDIIGQSRVDQSNSVQHAVDEFESVAKKSLDQSTERIQSQIAQLRDLCDSVKNQAVSVQKTAAPAAKVDQSSIGQADTVDRSRNIVIFGIEDTRDFWHMAGDSGASAAYCMRPQR